MQEKAKIFIRVRPLLSFQDQPALITTKNSVRCLDSKSVANKLAKSHLNVDKINSIEYNYDQVFENLSSQRIYKHQVKAMIEKSLKSSIDTTIVAYGQTNAGKTYTLLGVKNSPGFIPCVLRDIFSMAKQHRYRFAFKICYTEIYNQNLLDLLCPDNKKLKIVKGEEWGCQVLGAHKQNVKCFEECLDWLDIGENNRKYGEKKNHDHSSRSHTILRIYIERRDQNLGIIRSSINLVDLAGSQRLGEEKGTAETGYINKSLFQFSNVISKLSEEKQQHIPFRDSKLTRILESSLTQNSQIAIFFCVSPALLNLSETLLTLRLANKAKSLSVTHNFDGQSQLTHSEQILRLKKIVQTQQLTIKQMKKKISDLEKQIQSQHIIAKKQTSSVNIKGLVLFDLQQMILQFEGKIMKMDNRQISDLKQSFKQQLINLYSDYSKQIGNLLFNKKQQNYQIKVSQILLSSCVSNSNNFAEYRELLFKKMIGEFGKSNKLSQYTEMFQLCLKKLNIKGKQASKMMGEKIRKSNVNKIMGWGCKKDCRVFFTQKNDQYGISSLQMDQPLKNIVCGAHHTLAYTQKGEVFGWGKNDRNQIASTKQFIIQIPTKIQLNVSVLKVAAGWTHSICISDDGRVFSWGQGEDGQLGLGEITNATTPTQLDHSKHHQIHAIDVFAGHSHSGIIDINQNYYAFGFNGDCRLMLAEQKPFTYPTQIKIGKVKKVGLGVTHSCLLTVDGKIYCGGVGTNGELGVELDPTITGYDEIEVPSKVGEQYGKQKICPIVEVQYFSDENQAISISCGQNMTAVVTKNKELYTFGKSSYERLGHEERGIHKILDGVNQVQLGYRHGFAWDEDKKSVYGWGFNMYNQLGVLQAKDLKKPQVIQSMGDGKIESISAGFFHSAAISR